MVGEKYGRWTVLKDLGIIKRKARWLCECECGMVRELDAGSIKRGHSKSCGCLALENRNKAVTKHGLTGTTEHQTWKSMKGRCYNKRNPKYPRYGARGIKLHTSWENSFETFLNDMGKRPEDCDSIERLDNDGDYSPSNCKWATAKEQSNNTSENILLDYNDKTQTLEQWCEELGLNYSTTYGRIVTRGWGIERAFTAPITRPTVMVKHNGESKSISQWSRDLDIPNSTIHNLISNRGMSISDVIEYRGTP
jgi:hypothetical protein